MQVMCFFPGFQSEGRPTFSMCDFPTLKTKNIFQNNCTSKNQGKNRGKERATEKEP